MNDRRDEQEAKRPFADGISPLVILLGAAGAAALVVASQNEQGIKLVGDSYCLGDKAQVRLVWTSPTEDTEWDILRDNVTIATVGNNAKEWKSNLIDVFQQGNTHRYKIIGVQTKSESFDVALEAPRCDISLAQITAANIGFS